MENTPNETSIKKSILEKIKKGDIKKIPKFLFSLRGALFSLAIIVIFLIILFLASFILFSLQASGLWRLPIFGLKGIDLLIKNFPWILIALVITLVVIFEVLVNRYSFSYKRPLLYSFLVIIMMVIISSFFVLKTPLHKKIYQNSKGDAFIQSFYDKYLNPPPEEFHPGTVLEINTTGFILERGDKTTISVKISKNTQMPSNFEIHEGGRLLVVGKIKNGAIEAEAIDNAPASGRP